jgi:hypothetical protein
MAVLVIVEVPGGTEEMYDSMNEQMGVGDTWMPDGLITHTAGPIDGGWRVVDCWREAADFESQIPPKLVPMLEAYKAEHGLETGEPIISVSPLANVVSVASASVLA